MSRENYSTLGDMAFRTNEAMVFEARNSVSRHVHQNQLNAACLTTQRLHFHSNPIWYRPLSWELDYDPAYVQCPTPNVSIETVKGRTPGTIANKPRQVPTLANQTYWDNAGFLHVSLL
jgi:hypothetical protein